ncbi:MAG: hypothetical protein GY820_20535, partial [Gammaproteobacteria bacterium]|nr:hypothetical protein [Gammaproteobacteria bacterium]
LSPEETTDEKGLYVLDKRRAKRFSLTKGRTPKIRFKKGNFVRVKLLPSQTSAFAKSSEHSYGSDVYVIQNIKETRPEISYVLATPDGQQISTGSFPDSRLRLTFPPAQRPMEQQQKGNIVVHRPVTRSMNLHK